MNGRFLGALLFVASGLFAQAQATGLADDTIRRDLIGAWVVPKESSDYSDFNSHMVETFRADGTYSAIIYNPDDCHKALQKIEAKWSVQNGILISAYPNGGGAKDQVLEIDDNSVTLRSLDDGTTYTRARAGECGTPIS